MSQADELLILGEKIAESFPQQIQTYFDKADSSENNVQVLSALKEMVWEEWLSSIEKEEAERLSASFGLPLCVCFVLVKYPPTTPELNSKHRAGFAEARRQKKNYRMRVVNEEYKKGGGDLLTRAYQAYSDYMKYGSVSEGMPSYTKEAFMAQRVKETEEWFNDSEANLIGYPFVNSLSSKAQADYLHGDIGYHTFDIIWHRFGKDVARVVGKFPKSLTDGVFALQSGSDALEYSVEEDSVVSYTRRVTGKKKVVTQVERVEGDFKAAARTEEGKMELVHQLVEKKVLSPSVRRLDADDQQLYAVIYNMFKVGDEGPKEVSVKRLAKALGKTSRESDCKDVLNQVHKLSTFRVQHLEMDDTSLRFSDPEFFNATYEIKHAKKAEGKEGVKYDQYSIVEGQKRKSIVELIDEMNNEIDDDKMKYKYSDVVLSLEPSTATKNELMNNLNQIWLLSTYEDELPNRTKTVLRLLLARRIDLYRNNGGEGDSKVDIPYEYFIENLQLGSLRKSQMEKALENHLDILTGENRLLKEFTLDKKKRTVSLTFNPFSKAERTLYRLDQETEEV